MAKVDVLPLIVMPPILGLGGNDESEGGAVTHESSRVAEGMNTYSSEYVGCNRLLGYKTEFQIRVLCGRGCLCTILTERELDPILTYPTQRSTLDLLFLIKK